MRVPVRLRFMVLIVVAAFAAMLVHAASAAAAPDVAQMEDLLSAHGSPMTGSAHVFATAGYRHGVDPSFLIAIAGAETSFGRYLYAENGDPCTYNAFNWFYGATWPQSDFASWAEGIERVAAGLAGPLYHGSGLYSVDAIAPRYCPDGTAAWIANVTSFMAALGGDPADTRLAAGAAPPDPPEGLAGLEASVALATSQGRVGQHMKVLFTLVNTGSSALTLDGIGLAVRGPSGSAVDLFSDEPVTLKAGEGRQVEASWRPDTVGEWRGWIEVWQDDTSLIAGEESFSFEVRPPRGQQLRRSAIASQDLRRGSARP